MTAARFFVAIWAFLLANMGNVFAAEPEPVPTTIEAILQAPTKLSGKIVRLTGQIDNCVSLTCNICPSEMTRQTFDRDKCLGLEFERYADPRTNMGVSDLMDWAFRFSTLTLEARFDDSCLSSKTLVCTDRASVLFDARVERVLSRKTALDGIVSWYDFGTLTIPAPEDARGMRAEFEVMRASSEAKDVHLFIIDDNKNLIVPDASEVWLACVCLETSCEGRWPSRFFGGFQSVANPFGCATMAKFKIGWRVMPEEDY